MLRTIVFTIKDEEEAVTGRAKINVQIEFDPPIVEGQQ